MIITAENLKEIGLNENEAKVYLALIELGETAIIPLAKKAGIPRTTCYIITEQMEKAGLLSRVVRGAHTYFSAASPERLKGMTMTKEQQAKIQRELAEKLVPQLLLLSQKSPNGPKMQYFSGRQGIRAVFEDLISSGEIKNYYIGSLKSVADIAGERFIKDWARRRIKAGIFSYGIRIRFEEILPRLFKSSRKMMRNIRLAPDGFQSPLYMDIYGAKVAFISTAENGFGLIVESDDFSKTMKSMFDIIWSCSDKL